MSYGNVKEIWILLCFGFGVPQRLCNAMIVAYFYLLHVPYEILKYVLGVCRNATNEMGLGNADRYTIISDACCIMETSPFKTFP